jgi:hypothetical protein
LNHRLYNKAGCRTSHSAAATTGRGATTFRYVQPHSSQHYYMGIPLSTLAANTTLPAHLYFTYLAHTTRAKNSTPVTCCSWTPGGRRLLTGNQEGEFTLWDGITFSFELIMSAHDQSFRAYVYFYCLYIFGWIFRGNYTTLPAHGLSPIIFISHLIRLSCFLCFPFHTVWHGLIIIII